MCRMTEEKCGVKDKDRINDCQVNYVVYGVDDTIMIVNYD